MVNYGDNIESNDDDNKLKLSWVKHKKARVELSILKLEHQVYQNLNKFVCVKLNLTRRLF